MSRREQVLTIHVSSERDAPHESWLRHAIQELVKSELSKKKHRLGKVTVHVAKPDAIDQSALNFARSIKDAAEAAVNERLR